LNEQGQLVQLGLGAKRTRAYRYQDLAEQMPYKPENSPHVVVRDSYGKRIPTLDYNPWSSTTMPPVDATPEDGWQSFDDEAGVERPVAVGMSDVPPAVNVVQPTNTNNGLLKRLGGLFRCCT
jgi:hypothetical protein